MQGSVKGKSGRNVGEVSSRMETLLCSLPIPIMFLISGFNGLKVIWRSTEEIISPLFFLFYFLLVCFVVYYPLGFQWISLGELLSRCGCSLTVNELWALCYTCLSSLQSYIDFPGDSDTHASRLRTSQPFFHAADFCLVLQPIYVWTRCMWVVRETYCFCSLKQPVGWSSGCVSCTSVDLWSGLERRGAPVNFTGLCAGFRDEFYLAPEYQEHGIVTEKVGFTLTLKSLLTSLILHSCVSGVTSGLCLRRCCYSLGYSQVPAVTQSKTGSSSQAEETPPGDGKEDCYWET